MHPRITLLAAVAVSSVMISGCAATPSPEPSPSPSVSPVFASEEEALAAATEAYAAYLETSDAILQQAGGDPSRIEEHVAAAYGDEERDTYARYRESGNRITGDSSFDSIRLQHASGTLSTGDSLSVYLCYDVTDVQLIDSAGIDITPPDRIDRVPLEVEFEVSDGAARGLLIARSDVWSGQNFC